jgi:hypothetical protein
LSSRTGIGNSKSSPTTDPSQPKKSRVIQRSGVTACGTTLEMMTAPTSPWLRPLRLMSWISAAAYSSEVRSRLVDSRHWPRGSRPR